MIPCDAFFELEGLNSLLKTRIVEGFVLTLQGSVKVYQLSMPGGYGADELVSLIWSTLALLELDNCCYSHRFALNNML